ncbi:MAG: hypothetical protein Q8R50_12785, partial [Sediminibacterium sp.]|nr:hypothetical protein [Sediminibacterium sp.]
MKKKLAKIILIITVGLLFTHQLIPNYHHEEISSSSEHSHDDGGDNRGLPAHSIDHVFLINKTVIDIVKIFHHDTPLLSYYSRLILSPEIFSPTKYYFIEIRPPVSDYYLHLSL